MSGRNHSRAVKLGATVLARLAGPGAATDVFGIEPRTLRSWLAEEPAPDTDWAAVEELLLARGGEMAARGETKGLVATLTGAGISARNRRYQQLIARREARAELIAAVPAARQPTPTQLAMAALTWEQRALVCDLLGVELRDRDVDAVDDADPVEEADDAALLAWIAGIASLSADEVAEQRAALLPSEPEAPEQRVLDTWEPGLHTEPARPMVDVTPEDGRWATWDAIDAAQREQDA